MSPRLPRILDFFATLFRLHKKREEVETAAEKARFTVVERIRRPEEITVTPLARLVFSMPACVVYTDARVECWGSHETAKKLIAGTLAEKKGTSIGEELARLEKSRWAKKNLTPDIVYRAHMAALELAILVQDGRDTAERAAEIAERYNVEIVLALDTSNGVKYAVTPYPGEG